SGHSHAKTVKATKDANAAKKGKIFSKIGRLITIAAKDGTDPAINSKLRMAIDQSKRFNMPKENVERAIKKGTGELAGEKLEEVSFEGFGPGGIAIIVEGITDNINRTLNEIKVTLNQNHGKIAGEGAVKWMFDRKGDIVINNEEKTINKDEFELSAIDAGADDIQWGDGEVYVYTKPEDLEKVKKLLEERGFKTESASLSFVAKEEVEISEKEKEQAKKLFEALDENDAVNDIYSNLKN
ncbi:MAG: YebC/PmpR family DNA-binding transcriptional regulator, partial [bacterium]